MSTSRDSRRRFLKLSASGAIVAVVAGVGGFLVLQQTQPQPAPASAPLTTPKPAPAAPAPTSTPSLVEQAKAEGKVTLYSAQSDADSKFLSEAFMKKYPGITMDYRTGGGGEFITKMLTEHRAGVRVMDVGVGTSPIITAVAEGIVANYTSAEDAAYPPEYRDPGGLWVAFQSSVNVIVYNTRLVKKEDIPQSYWDLLKPRFKDRISIYDPRGAPYIPLIVKRKVIGEDRYAEFLKGLRAQNPKIVRGSGQNIAFLKSGEAEIALWLFTGSTAAAMNEGTPIDFVRRKGTLLGSPMSVWVHKFPPHPNAARLLRDYILSEEWQKKFTERSKEIILRRGVETKVGVGLGTGEEVTPDMLAIVWPYTQKESDDSIEEFKKFMEIP